MTTVPEPTNQSMTNAPERMRQIWSGTNLHAPDAARQMLEALQLVNDTYFATQKRPSVVQEAHCMNVVRDAIAAATGEPA
jgi:hypothetical protein